MPLNAFKDALVAKLRADASVSALVGEKIYDEAPRDDRGDASDADAPYCYLGAMNWRRMEGCSPLFDVTIRVFAVSTDFGRDEARSIAEALRAALELKKLTLAGGHAASECLITGGGDFVATDRIKQAFIDVNAIVTHATAYSI